MAQDDACLFSKRLEQGRFVWPSAKAGKIALTPAQLAMRLEAMRRIRKPSVGRFSRRRDRGAGICPRSLYREPAARVRAQINDLSGCAGRGGRGWPARAAIASANLLCQRVRSSAGAPVRACSPMCWSTIEGGPWPQWGRVSPLRADHLPLYRQSRIIGRDGLDLGRSTLADWSGQIHRPAGTAGRCHRAACAGGAGDLCRRHPLRVAGAPSS